MYRLKLISRNQYLKYLLDSKYAPEDAEKLIRLVDVQISLDSTVDNTKSYQNSLINNVLKAYTAKIISHEDAVSKLSSAGLPDAQIEAGLALADYEYVLDMQNSVIKALSNAYLSGSIDRGALISALAKLNIPSAEQTQILAEFDSVKDIRYRRLTEAQYRSAHGLGIITMDEYKQSLIELGYCDKDIEILLKMYGTP